MNEIKLEQNKYKRLFYQGMGVFCVIMGILGIFLPVWPTTIFIILAAWFFVRSSEKYYLMLIRNRMFGKIIKNYREYRGIESKARIKSLTFLWLTLLISMFLVGNILITLLLLCVGIGVTWHLYT
ncbi:MAG: YbaN family protein [Candidatus Kapaibacterium sp.]